MNSTYSFKVLRVLRRRLDLTLEELARVSGLAYATVEAVETNKTQPSLKTLDALAGALQISTSNLIGLAETRHVQRRKAQQEPIQSTGSFEPGLENCKVARYAHGKLIRVTAQAGDLVHVMGLHGDVHEFCYVLSGCVELRVDETTYELRQDDTILFDGVLDHAYRQIETGEYITAHIPKDIRNLEILLTADKDSPH
jgi:transcriptional regulator with XRE-family HTH domain